MATVYLARDLRHDRPVALKVLHPELAATLGPERFQREIQLAARLQHPHILTVLDSGEAAGQLWFTMPFVEGESLRDRLDRERQLPVEDALRIAARGGAGARLRPPARRDPPRHQAREHPAHAGRRHAGGRLRDRPGAGRRREQLTETGLARRHAGLHEPGAGQRRERSSTPAPTSTRSAACCTRCWPASRRSPARRRRRSSRSGCGARCRDVRVCATDGAAAVGEAVTRALAPVPGGPLATAGDLAKALGAGTTASVTTARPSAPTPAPTTRGRRPAARRMPAGLVAAADRLSDRGGRALRLATWHSHAVRQHRRPECRRAAVREPGRLERGVLRRRDHRRGAGQAVGPPRAPGDRAAEAAGSTSTPTKPPPQIAQELGADYLLLAHGALGQGIRTGARRCG